MNRKVEGADEALARLIEGNERFLSGKSRRASPQRGKLAELAKGQRPYAAILGCSDSRVPPEWIFDAGLGELFVVRVAGNVISPEGAGSLEYAGFHLGTPLCVVLGHGGCGAIGAALATKHEGTQYRSSIQILVDSIVPAIPDFEPTASPEQGLSHAVESNVRRTVRQIMESPEGRMKVVGAIYDIESGRVAWLPQA